MKTSSIAREHFLRGLPAVIVALIAITTGAYGKWGLRNRMLPEYSERLAESREAYSGLDLAGVTPQALIQSGSTVDICYSRLDGMGATADPWERLLFYETHIQNLRTQVPAKNDETEEASDELDSAIATFADKYDRLLERLCSLDSEYLVLANLKVARRQLTGQFQLSQAQASLERLLERLDDPSLAADQQSEISATVMQLKFEILWHRAEAMGELPPKKDELADIWQHLETSSSNPILAMQLASFVQPAEAIKISTELLATIERDKSLSDRFEEAMVAYMVQGDWTSVRGLLGQKFAVADRDEQLSLRLSIARHIGRMLYSKLGRDESAWNSTAAQGLDLALELYPNLPQLNGILWDIAASHADASQAISPDLVEAILVSESKQRFLLLAISNAIRGSTDTALNYLRFAKDSAEEEAYFRLANIAVMQSTTGEPNQQQALLDVLQASFERQSSGSEEVSTLSQSSAQLALAASHLQIALNQLGDAKDSIETAREALGTTPSVQYAESRLRMLLSAPRASP